MVRYSTNYGATNGNSPPPYTNFYRQQNGPSQTYDNFSNVPLQKPLSVPERLARMARTPWFLVFLTLVTTLGVCMTTMPITYCNDPLLNPGEQDRIRKEWRTEILEHEKQVAEREVSKVHWAWENEQHENLVSEWAQERAEHERELKERGRREEEERKRLNLFWGHVETHQCKTYGTREYTAVLMNLPADWERRMEACRATPLDIHGIMQMPTSCEDKGYVIVGRWEINQNEPDCKPYWSWYKDKESLSHCGCTSHESGKRRIEHYLDNLPKGGDYRDFCATTPVRFHGMEFIGAHECFQSGGTYGLWEIDDTNC